MPHHHHSHSHEDSCGSNSCHSKQDQNCESGHTHDHDPASFACEFLELADEAWLEVLKEEIKDHIRKNNGPHIKELAKLISETNHARWEHKMAAEKGCREYQENLCRLFSQSCEKK